MMVGQSISHYKLVSQLGEGGMGVVYKAEDTKLNRQVALKFLPLETLDEQEVKARLIRKAQAQRLSVTPTSGRSLASMKKLARPSSPWPTSTGHL